MKAKEMFKELGYKRPDRMLFSERYGHVLSWQRKTQDKFYNIIFINDKCKVNMRCGTIKDDKFEAYTMFDSSLELHLAIHQQMIELGWLD